MNKEKSDYVIPGKGREEFFDYLKKQKIFFLPDYKNRIDRRIQISMEDLGLKSYDNFLNLIKKDDNTFNALIKWLERGKIYDDQKKSYAPLIRNKKFNRRKSKKRIKKDLSNLPHFSDPEDIEFIPKLYSFLESNNINHKAYKEKYFLRRVWSRMLRNDALSYQDYLKVLKKNSSEINELQDTLSINVTRFFRDIDLFTKLDRELLPKICGKKNENIRVWSAGCAVGAEAYSIAIMIARIRKNDFSQVKLFATDICQDFLNQARRGLYSYDLLSELGSSQIATFFKQIDRDLFQINSEIRKTVTFKQHDLRITPPFKELNLILCRNVLIYFAKQESEMLFKRFHNALKSNGYLVLGKCELIPASVRHLFTKVDSRTRIYQRL